MRRRADGAFFEHRAFAVKWDLCWENVLLSGAHCVDIQVTSYGEKTQSIVYIAWLGWFVFYCTHFTSYRAGGPGKYEPGTSIIHNVHRVTAGNCRRLTAKETATQSKKKCVILLLVTQNFTATHFSQLPSNAHTARPGASAFCRLCTWCAHLYANDTVRIGTVIHFLLGRATAVWPDLKISRTSEYQIWSWLKYRHGNSDLSLCDVFRHFCLVLASKTIIKKKKHLCCGCL